MADVSDSAACGLTNRLHYVTIKAMSTSPSDPAEDAPDPSVAEAERRLRLLKELTEIGMELARKLRDRAGEEDAKGRDPADAFARLSRAIRLTLSLEAKTLEHLRDLKAGIVRAAAIERLMPGRSPIDEMFDRAQSQEIRAGALVGDVIEAEVEDGEARGDLYEALNERFEEDEAYWLLDQQPLRDIVERLCKDLCLTPDWSRWEGDDWAPGYRPIRPRDSIFNQPSPRPLLRNDDEPPAVETFPDRTRQLE